MSEGDRDSWDDAGPPARKQPVPQRMLFIGVALAVSVAAYFSHRYFTSDSAQIRRITSDAREHPLARQLVSERHCVDAYLYTPAQAALMIHLRGVGEFQGESKSHHLWCQGGASAGPSHCLQVRAAYDAAGGKDPVNITTFAADGSVACTVMSTIPVDPLTE